MKNKDLYNLLEGIKDIISSNYKGIPFSFFLVKNKKLLEEEITLMENSIKMPQKYIEFEQKKIELLKKCSTDSTNNIRYQQISATRIQYLLQDDKKDLFETSIKELIEEYKDYNEEFSQKLKEQENFLNEESTLQLNKINQTNLPENISTLHFEVLFPLIIE